MHSEGPPPERTKVKKSKKKKYVNNYFLERLFEAITFTATNNCVKIGWGLSSMLVLPVATIIIPLKKNTNNKKRFFNFWIEENAKLFCLRDRGRLGNEGRPILLKIGTQSSYVDLCNDACNMPKFQHPRPFFAEF